MLCAPAPEAAAEFLAAAAESRGRFAGFADPPGDARSFRAWSQRARSPRSAGFLVRLRNGGRLVGAVCLNEIEPEPRARALLSCYGFRATAGAGLVTEAARELLAHGFGALGLRQVAADVRPENAASLAMLRRLDFVRMAAAERLLRVGGDWHLHQRWCIDARRWRQLGGRGQG